MSISIGILKKYDEVLNIWQSNNLIKVAVKNQKGEVYIHSISLDENGMARVDKDLLLIIKFGNGEVTATKSVTSTNPATSTKPVTSESTDDLNSVVHGIVDVASSESTDDLNSVGHNIVEVTTF